MALGLSGRVARAFLNSRLTPLLTVASLVVGVGAVLTTPREEEPQISVPMVDVFSSLPGATPEEVDRRITEPLERRLWEISGVEHLYSMSRPSGAMTTVRFRVGDDPEESVVKVFAKLAGTPGAGEAPHHRRGAHPGPHASGAAGTTSTCCTRSPASCGASSSGFPTWPRST